MEDERVRRIKAERGISAVSRPQSRPLVDYVEISKQRFEPQRLDMAAFRRELARAKQAMVAFSERAAADHDLDQGAVVAVVKDQRTLTGWRKPKPSLMSRLKGVFAPQPQVLTATHVTDAYFHSMSIEESGVGRAVWPLMLVHKTWTLKVVGWSGGGPSPSTRSLRPDGRGGYDVVVGGGADAASAPVYAPIESTDSWESVDSFMAIDAEGELAVRNEVDSEWSLVDGVELEWVDLAEFCRLAQESQHRPGLDDSPEHTLRVLTAGGGRPVPRDVVELFEGPAGQLRPFRDPNDTTRLCAAIADALEGPTFGQV